MDKIKTVASCLNMTEEQANDVCNLFDNLVKGEYIIAQNVVLHTPDDYIGWWEDAWFCSMSYEQLVQSEVNQGGFEGDKPTWRKQAEDFCEGEMNNTVFKLPCGMYAQYVG